MSGAGDPHVETQAVAGVVAAEQASRLADEAAALSRQDLAFQQALGCIERVRDFIAVPGGILGNPNTKHGEIAEQVEVGVRNARDLLAQRATSATFDGVGRTAPEDYLINGEMVQSKFINGLNNNLDHVLEHMRKYESFGRDGSFYHIPHDHHEKILRVLQGESVDGMNARTLASISEKAREIEALSGQPFDSVVRPGVSQYAEVQQGRIEQTLDEHERVLREQKEALDEGIRAEHLPDLSDVAGVAAKGAIVGAAVRVTYSIYRKHNEGKSLFQGDFTVDDWQELGLDATKGAAQGGVTAGTIFAITHYANVAAPFAGAVVSSSLAVADLSRQYRNGEITFEQFIELGHVACAEGACVGLSAAIGQVVIPVPLLGATIGAVAGRWLASLARDHLAEEEQRLAVHLDALHAARMQALDVEYRALLERVLEAYDRLSDLTCAAFDVDTNVALRLQASVHLAAAHGVPESLILHDTDDLDAFMLK